MNLLTALESKVMLLLADMISSFIRKEILIFLAQINVLHNWLPSQKLKKIML